MNRSQNRSKWVVLFCLFILAFSVRSLSVEVKDRPNQFKQLGAELPSPNQFRTASGAPGPAYWQQKVDYDMSITLDDTTQTLSGEETIIYHNNSPDPLSYLWVQLDQNLRKHGSISELSATGRLSQSMSFRGLERMHDDYEGGFNIDYVKDSRGNDLPHTIVHTMMRVDLPEGLLPGSSLTFRIKWWYNINDRSKQGGRSGLDFYEKDGNYVYAIAQFFPRLAVYDEAVGWNHKQFLGSGEFTLPFGDYRVALTVPSDHIVGATGELQNATEVLTQVQQKRLAEARAGTDQPVLIVTEREAAANEETAETDTKTWVFEAKTVRDFAFASSRKFIWDALALKFGDRVVLNMSYYPKEGNPLWGQYSTKAVAHAVSVYSRFTFDYPYPVSISVLTGRGGGMEYPMVTFNGGKPEPDGTYSESRKWSLIGVIIHEVGHNFFPMIVNSDERQWGWMDEGMNTFMEYLAEQEWSRNFGVRNGPAYTVIDYMKGDKSDIQPIMTASDIDTNYGANAYDKTSAGLNILRETILGRELFDFAFKEYARRWMFKHPTPADFFRTMEDASGMDLDWFWRGWFYGTDHVDLAIEDMNWYRASTGDPKLDKAAAYEKANEHRKRYISNIRNAKEISKTAEERDESLKDFYSTHDPKQVYPLETKKYKKYLASLTDEQKALLQSGYNYYQIDVTNLGGMVMPLILRFEYTDGTESLERIPAEIWRRTNDHVSKVFWTKKEIHTVTLDPYLETADVDERNNRWRVTSGPEFFKVRKMDQPASLNTMQRSRKK
jgi:hypothetical protein